MGATRHARRTHESSAPRRIAVSPPQGALAQAQRAVAKGLDDFADLLDEMLAETGGPLTPAERRRADAAMGVRRRSKSGLVRTSVRPRSA